MVSDNSPYADSNAKQAIESGTIYNVATVSSVPDPLAIDYIGRLLCRKKRVAGRMLDEWISSAPLLNRVAFRHIFVCEKSVNY